MINDRRTSGDDFEDQRKEAIRRRDKGEESLAEIGRSYNVSGWTIEQLEG